MKDNAAAAALQVLGPFDSDNRNHSEWIPRRRGAEVNRAEVVGAIREHAPCLTIRNWPIPAPSASAPSVSPPSS